MFASSDVPILDAILIQRFCNNNQHILPLQGNETQHAHDNQWRILGEGPGDPDAPYQIWRLSETESFSSTGSYITF